MPKLLDFTASFTDSPFWSSLTFMRTNPSNLALLFGSNYTQRINSSLNLVANPFHLRPLPQCPIAGTREWARTAASEQWSIRSIFPPWQWQCESWLRKNKWPWQFFWSIVLLFPQYLVVVLGGLEGISLPAPSVFIHALLLWSPFIPWNVKMKHARFLRKNPFCLLQSWTQPWDLVHSNRGFFIDCNYCSAILPFCQEPLDLTDLQCHEVPSDSWNSVLVEILAALSWI